MQINVINLSVEEAISQIADRMRRVAGGQRVHLIARHPDFEGALKSYCDTTGAKTLARWREGPVEHFDIEAFDNE